MIIIVGEGDRNTVRLEGRLLGGMLGIKNKTDGALCLFIQCWTRSAHDTWRMCELDFSKLAGTGDDNVMLSSYDCSVEEVEVDIPCWLVTLFLSRVNFFFKFKGSKDSILQEQN